MSNKLKNTRKTTIILLTLAFIGFWILITYFPAKFSNINAAKTMFTNTYGIIAFIGGVFALFVSRYWGGYKSLIGKAIFLFGLGLLAQEFGQLMYAYYIYVKKIDVPYPSLGDIGYLGSVFLYIMAVYQLLKATGSKFSLVTISGKLQALVIPLLLAISYMVFLKGYSFSGSSALKIILDFGYPLLQATYVALALLTFTLSRKYLGGIMRPVILLVLVSLIIQYISDFSFLYQVKQESWAPAGVNDLIYLVSYGFMSISLLGFESIFSKMRMKNNEPKIEET